MKVKKDNSEQYEEMLYGQKKQLVLPSGYEVTIREQNGHDDDILSNASTVQDLSNIDIFLSSLIIQTDLPFATGGKLSTADMGKMLLRDKYYLLFASRIHSMGNIIKFTFDWGKDNGGEVEYVDDLNNFVWDYSKPMPEKDDEAYYPYRIEPYVGVGGAAHGKQEIKLQSGKELRFELLNGKAEKVLLKLKREEQTRNSEIKARGLELKHEGSWVKVDNFVYFTKRDMAELHKKINELDPSFRGITELENPQTKEITYFPIMNTTSFFYPEEI